MVGVSGRVYRWFILGTIAVIIVTTITATAGFLMDRELNSCSTPLPSNSVIGIDILIYLRAGRCFIAQHLSPYVEGAWQDANPQNPNTNARAAPWVYVLFSVPEQYWPISKVLTAIVNAAAGWVGIAFYVWALQKILPTIEWWRYFCFAYFAGILWIQIGFINLDPVMLFLSGLLFWAITVRYPKVAGVTLACILSLKLHLWAWPLFIPLVKGNIRQLVYIVLITLLTLLLMVVTFLVLVGPEYGSIVIAKYAFFLKDAARNIFIQGPEAKWHIFNNSIHQTLVRYFGFQTWIPPVVTVITVMLWGYLGVLVFIVHRNLPRYYDDNLVALLVAVQAHVVFMLTSPQVETVMIITVALPLLWGLRSIMKVHGLHWLLPYFWIDLPLILFMVTRIEILNIPFSMPIVLVTFIVLGLIMHQTISKLYVSPSPAR